MKSSVYMRKTAARPFIQQLPNLSVKLMPRADSSYRTEMEQLKNERRSRYMTPAVVPFIQSAAPDSQCKADDQCGLRL